MTATEERRTGKKRDLLLQRLQCVLSSRHLFAVVVERSVVEERLRMQVLVVFFRSARALELARNARSGPEPSGPVHPARPVVADADEAHRPLVVAVDEEVLSVMSGV